MTNLGTYVCGCEVAKRCPEHGEDKKKLIDINTASRRYKIPADTIRTSLNRGLLTKIGVPISLYVDELESLIESKRIGTGKMAKKLRGEI